MTRFMCDGIFNDTFIGNFQEFVKMKKKLKIGQYLMKLCLKYYWFVFFPDTVYAGFVISSPVDIVTVSNIGKIRFS